MAEFLKERAENMDPMDIGEYQESVRKDFMSLTEMFRRNFRQLDPAKLEQFRIKVSDLIDLLKSEEKPKY